MVVKPSALIVTLILAWKTPTLAKCWRGRRVHASSLRNDCHQAVEVTAFPCSQTVLAGEDIHSQSVTNSSEHLVSRVIYGSNFFRVFRKLIERIASFVRWLLGLKVRVNGMYDESGPFIFAKQSLSWDGLSASEAERNTTQLLRQRLRDKKSSCKSNWVKSATDVELLRFLRYNDGDVDHAWSMIERHIAWRRSCYGAETVSSPKKFAGSLLHNEMFWIGPNKQGVPTLVVRTQVHDGDIYNNDPKEYCK